MLGVRLEPDPVLITLGVPVGARGLQVAQQCLLSHGLLTAKKLILLFWKKKEVSNVKHWLTELTETLHLERIRFVLTNKLREFDRIWPPLIS